MKYDSLKKTTTKTFKVPKFDGGLNSSYFSPSKIDDNQLSDCKNVWFKDGVLQTRAGLAVDIATAYETDPLGYWSMYKYKIHDTVIHKEGVYYRLATSYVETDDYVYIINVYLISEYGQITSLGKISYFRTTSDIFYTPINVLFYTGKAQTGGGIFAMVTVQNGWYSDDRYYNFYEISEDMTEWNKVYNFYVPTLYINGRGNKYEIAKAANQVTSVTPKTLESPNMLNGRFHAYYTSDGYSNLFRLPFTNLSAESVVCRIYYSLADYVEWTVSGTSIIDTKTFFGKSVTMEVDREKGTIYFTSSDADYAIPVMNMYHENNIKVTATKEIENGAEKIMYSSCALSHDSRIFISGGESGNQVFVTNYETPLYFPQNSSVEAGVGDSEIIGFSAQSGKVIALKRDGLYTITLKKGNRLSDISLLADNDKLFTECDSLSCEEITKEMGCLDKGSIAVMDNNTVYLGNDGNLYALTSLTNKRVICLSENIGKDFADFKYADFAVANDSHYMLFKDNKAFVFELTSPEKPKVYYWEFPADFKITGGIYRQKKFIFLCTGENQKLSYLATLTDDKDAYLYYNDDSEITLAECVVESSITTKHFDFSSNSVRKNIESIYLALASKGSVSIAVNGKEIADINFRLTDHEYEDGEFKSVKLMPHINNANSVFITLSGKSGMTIGELEIIYKKIG